MVCIIKCKYQIISKPYTITWWLYYYVLFELVSIERRKNKRKTRVEVVLFNLGSVLMVLYARRSAAKHDIIQMQNVTKQIVQQWWHVGLVVDPDSLWLKRIIWWLGRHVGQIWVQDNEGVSWEKDGWHQKHEVVTWPARSTDTLDPPNHLNFL